MKDVLFLFSISSLASRTILFNDVPIKRIVVLNKCSAYSMASSFDYAAFNRG